GTAEVLLDALELLLGVGAQRRRRLDVAERDRDLHGDPFPISEGPRRGPGRRGRHRSGMPQYTCLRLEDGRMPISSRYFATVRRAMSICSLPSISAMYWSLSGFFASSLAMIPRILSFTLSAETSSPRPLRRLEVKKYFSSNVPCGVWTYLPAVARLTVDSCTETILVASAICSIGAPSSRARRSKRRLSSIGR